MGFRRRLQTVEAPPTIASTLAGLGTPDGDGAVGIIRIGTYPDVHEEGFVWSAAASKWIGTREHVLISQADTWGMDLSNRALAAFRNQFCRFYSALPYGKVHSHFTGSVALPQATITLASASEFPASGQLRVRDQVVAYTGKAGNDLTGCTGGSGTFPANTIVTLNTSQVGGWGTEVTPFDRVGDLWAAGFRLEERVNCWLNGSIDDVSMSVAPYYFNYNLAEDFNAPPTAPSGGLGLGLIATGPASDLHALDRSQERPFNWTTVGWTAWDAPAPTKRFLHAALYGRMNSAAANDNGEVYGYTLRLRWVSS